VLQNYVPSVGGWDVRVIGSGSAPGHAVVNTGTVLLGAGPGCGGERNECTRRCGSVGGCDM
jgi:hypothetical protein